ncbi:MAG: hypothetical protein NUV68_03460 [Caldiserica bacterium]|jgi:L-fucose isomerase-like protein|nr:hypothetical protein [Caldisericota bacterium]MDH7562400.1 hypothetical protein [Caldisericota bacterium]
MKFPLIPLVSPLSDPRTTEETLSRIRFQLSEILPFLEFLPMGTSLEGPSSFEVPVVLFLITGGTERAASQVEAPEYLLLVHPSLNSLPAALELRTFLENAGKKARIITVEEARRTIPLKARVREGMKKFLSSRILLVGEPASWLVGSILDHDQLEKKFKINIKKIPLEELIQAYENSPPVQDLGIFLTCPWKGIEKGDLPKALKLSQVLDEMVRRGGYTGVSLSCFDLLSRTGQTGCLSLANLNNSAIPASCEGDLPSLVTMLLLNSLSGKPSFMGNPSWIEKDQLTLAHCTIAPSLTRDLCLSTHFESGKSVALEGALQPGNYTISKVAPSLEGIFFASVQVLPGQRKPNLCRTQVLLKFPGAEAIKNLPLGNHLILSPGDLSLELDEASQILGLVKFGNF